LQAVVVIENPIESFVVLPQRLISLLWYIALLIITDCPSGVKRRHTKFTAPLKTWVGDITATTTKTQDLLHGSDTHVAYRESDIAQGFPMMKDLELITHWQVTQGKTNY
jgi:hypothetical protein